MDRAVPAAGAAAGAAHDLRAVLRITSFRRLWRALAFSSLGDWLGLLATTSLAAALARSYQGSLYAIGGVLAVRMAPALLFGPLAGAVVDRLDRRRLMVGCDLMRAGLFASIPLVHGLAYLLIASFAVEVFSLFWIPAKEASVPNLVPHEQLEAANQVSLVTSYGTAPVAAGLFALLALLTRALQHGATFFGHHPESLALWIDAASFAFSAFTVYRLREIGRAKGRPVAGDESIGLLSSVVEGWRFVGTTPMVRGLVAGILGAFAAGGAVVALGRVYVQDLGGGNAGYGVLFGAMFLGLALGMLLGPRALEGFSRRRLFGLSITGAGLVLAVTAVLPNIVVAVATTTVVGGFAGIAWVTGITLLGGEVDDAVRGRTFSLVQSLIQVELLLVLAAAPIVAGAIGARTVPVLGGRMRWDGVTIVLLVAGLLAAAVGALALRQMDDRRGVPLLPDLVAAVRGRRYRGSVRLGGLFIAFEGGDGAGKSTQVARLGSWLRDHGYEVVCTREPGATEVGRRLRGLLLDPSTELSPRAEALLYAADRAAHVERVIGPALRRGAVVVTDRFVDSSIAYQGAGRELPAEEIAELSGWATAGLRPDLTVLLDLEPEIALQRSAGSRDRIEGESVEFHRRVRDGFRRLAERRPESYLVLDASQPEDVIAAHVAERVAALLPRRDGDSTAGTLAAGPRHEPARGSA